MFAEDSVFQNMFIQVKRGSDDPQTHTDICSNHLEKLLRAWNCLQNFRARSIEFRHKFQIPNCVISADIYSRILQIIQRYT